MPFLRSRSRDLFSRNPTLRFPTPAVVNEYKKYTKSFSFKTYVMVLYFQKVFVIFLKYNQYIQMAQASRPFCNTPHESANSYLKVFFKYWFNYELEVESIFQMVELEPV